MYSYETCLCKMLFHFIQLLLVNFLTKFSMICLFISLKMFPLMFKLIFYNFQFSEPLPMKQRALPQSFWQQPNLANPQPPGIIYSTLPPLPLNGEDATDMTPVEEVPSISSSSYTSYSSSSSSESSSASVPMPKRAERFVSTANTDLLFSLFNTIEEEEAQRRIHIVRRGR